MHKLEPMLDEYYELRGWDKKTGIPSDEKLEELALQEILPAIGAIRKKEG